MSGTWGLACLVTILGAVFVHTSTGQARGPTAVTLDRNVLHGQGLDRIAPYKKEVTISGMQQMSARELFKGAFVVDVWETQDGGTLLLKNYPFDQFVQVLQGTTTLISSGGVSRSYAAGDLFVVPRGFNGTWTVSRGFREILIIEAESLQAGIGQFE